MIDPRKKTRIFEETVAQNARFVRIIARNHDPGDGWQDLEQEILMAFWRSLDRYELRSSPGTWLYSVARNTARDFARKNRNASKRFGCAIQEAGGSFRDGHDLDAMKVVEEFIATLSEQDRQVFGMYLDGLGYPEMAAVTGADETTLRKRMSRVKEQFKARYNGS